VCGWVGRGSVVSWGELWEVACLCVGEVKCLGAARLAANLFPAKSAKEQKNRSLGKKTKERKPRISRF